MYVISPASSSGNKKVNNGTILKRRLPYSGQEGKARLFATRRDDSENDKCSPPQHITFIKNSRAEWSYMMRRGRQAVKKLPAPMEGRMSRSSRAIQPIKRCTQEMPRLPEGSTGGASSTTSQMKRACRLYAAHRAKR